MSPQNLSERIRAVRARMTRAAVEAGRSAQSVTLLAVSKAQPAPMVRAAASCGLGDFGESYLQEALAKLAALRDLPLTWHFIGRLQANKTRPGRGELRLGPRRRPPQARRAARGAAPRTGRAAERVPAGEPGRRGQQGRRHTGGAAGARRGGGIAAAPQAARAHVHPAGGGRLRAPARLVSPAAAAVRGAERRAVRASTRSRWA